MAFFSSAFHISPFLLLIIGFCGGTMSAFYGIGGGWLITPVLNILGLPMPYAIGTSLVYILITSIFGTIRHSKLKNISFIIGIIIGVSALGGILIGKRIILYLERQGSVDTYVRILYIFFLSAVGTYMLFEKKHNYKSAQNTKKRLIIPPVLHIRNNVNQVINISLITMLLIGFFIGFLQSTMGIGGGFVLLPILIYFLKFPVTLSIGTSLFSVLIVGFQGAAVYIVLHKIDWRSILYMIFTTIIGTYLGSSATKRINPDKIKILFAITVLCGAFAVLFKQLDFRLISNIVIFSVAIFSTLAIIYSSFIKKAK